MLPYLLTLGGFALLFAGGEALVRGAVGISKRFGLSEMLIGLTVVAFGTSAPELLVSVSSALRGQADIAVGNVVGSNICNIALILGAASLIKPITVDRREVRADALIMVAATLALVGLAFLGEIGRFAGAVLFGSLIVYIVTSYRREMRHGHPDTGWHAEEAREFEPAPAMGISALLLASGLGALVLGADWLVDGASAIADSFGVPQAVIALTVVALGTSLPELATSVVVAFRGHSDVAVGNVLGSNIFNVLSILGITAMVLPISIDPHIARTDVPVMFALAVIAAGLLLWKGGAGRIVGGALTAGYFVYVVALFAFV